MSPATQKLSAFRQKHLNKKSVYFRDQENGRWTDMACRTKPQTLFRQSSAKNLEAAKSSNMFVDIVKDGK